MHLQQLKDSSGKSWADLQEDCGVNRTMLWDVAQGWKYPGADTAPGLIKLGVSLDDQAKFYESRAAARAERAARKAEQQTEQLTS
jgi:hypothetical protein